MWYGKAMTKVEEMKQRAFDLGLRVLRLVRALPRGLECGVIGSQILRSATSVGANYRAAQRGRSKAEFASKLAIAEEEADETCYWLELILAASLLPKPRIEPLLGEAKQIAAILTTAVKTARQR
jgi:four helix bundle protein